MAAAGQDGGHGPAQQGPGQRGRTGDADRVVSRDEQAVGWGDERFDPTEDEDVARLLADRPPHHDRD